MQKLAIDGGPKAVTNKLTGWPQFDEKAISAVTEVLEVGQGELLDRPERDGVREEVRRVAGEQVRHQRGHRHGGAARRLERLGHRPGRRGDRAQLHVHRHQLFGGAGRRRFRASPT